MKKQETMKIQEYTKSIYYEIAIAMKWFISKQVIHFRYQPWLRFESGDANEQHKSLNKNKI